MIIDFLMKNFWIFFILVTVVNACILKVRSQGYIQESPRLEEGYRKYFYGILWYGNIPWIIMGIGNVTGLTDNGFQYFYPRSLNPAVLVFHASIIFLWIYGAIWIYKKQGAEFIEAHPGFVYSRGFLKCQNKNLTAKQVKFFYPLMVCGGVVAMAMMWIGFFPEV